MLLTVSIHAPVMDAKAVEGWIVLCSPVSIHAPVMDAKRHVKTSITQKLSFNPRARDGREIRHTFMVAFKFSFNPRARDGRETFSYYNSKSLSVSIHAPVMDANCQSRSSCISCCVSIHAPVMDAKAVSESDKSGARRFNPRARDGREYKAS